MPDVGDWVTPTLTVSPADGTTAAALTITAPDGTTVAGSGEATADTGATWTADQVELDAPGMWLLTWTVTGTGQGVEHQQITVPAAPTSMESPTSLATISDLVFRLGRDLTSDETARAPGLLSSASVKIRAYTRRTFASADDAEIVLRPVGSTLRLPQTPVVTVGQVEQIGTAGTPDRVMAVSEWEFDGIDRIELWPCPRPLTGAPPTGSYADTYRVTYDYGLTVPDFIVDLCCDVVQRTLTSPTSVAGLVQERIGQYSYQFGQFPGGQSPGTSVQLSADDKRALREAGYRRTASTIQVRAG